MKLSQHNDREQDQHSHMLIQPSPEIGKEDDEQEKEANSVADKVMKMSDPEAGKKKMMDGSGGKLQMMQDEEEGAVKPFMK